MSNCLETKCFYFGSAERLYCYLEMLKWRKISTFWNKNILELSILQKFLIFLTLHSSLREKQMNDQNFPWGRIPDFFFLVVMSVYMSCMMSKIDWQLLPTFNFLFYAFIKFSYKKLTAPCTEGIESLRAMNPLKAEILFLSFNLTVITKTWPEDIGMNFLSPDRICFFNNLYL